MNDSNENNQEFIFVDPKNDVAFRKIFGDENKKEILISFLNNILEFSGTDKEIMDITIKNPYQVPKLKELKETILDIKAIDKRNIHYIIEMQMKWSKEELEAYDARGIYIQDERGRIEYALQEGKKEEKIETARKMLADSLPIETISKYTGLSSSEIEKLE
jgi:hypothetical protein